MKINPIIIIGHETYFVTWLYLNMWSINYESG